MAANESITSQPQAGGSDAATIPLPAPAKAPPTADPLALWAKRLDALLVVVTLAFAFLTASFAASNSDFFFQAATGRLLAQNRYTFGVDPFACSTENVYWANHSWLFGVVTHAVYDSFPGHGTDDNSAGGIILVVAKALLVAILAWLIFVTGRQRGKSVWIPAACALLAVLAVSPRVWLNSTTLSYVYLGLTLFLLRRPRWNPPPIPDAPAKKGKAKVAMPVTVGYPFKAFWAIPPLCILWVNTDSWFFLGPLTVALYLAGELIEQAQTQPDERAERPLPGELKTLGYVLVVSIGACFINPHHYHAFTLPAQLGFNNAGETLRSDSQFRVLFLSPFEDLYYTKPRLGLNVAGLAYFPLLLLGLLSFAVNYRAIRPWRVLVWLPFAGLSALSMRAIPFFAVVAGPIMALNFLDFAATLPAQDYTTPGWRGWRIGGRLLSVVAGLALVVCTVPGWLQAQPYDKRRVAWNVHVEPSWKAVGAQVSQWRQQGLLTDGEAWFNTSPDVLNYMAYYCDGQRGFLDGRLQLYDQTAADYVAVRKALNVEEDEADKKENRPTQPPWRDVFPRYKVRYVIMRTDPKHLLQPLIGTPSRPGMLLTQEEWTPLYADGETFIFGWNHPQETPPSGWATMRLNYDREAFGPGAMPVQRAQTPEAPHIREWYEAFYEPEKPRALAVNLAVFHDLYDGVRQGRWGDEQRARWMNLHALVVGATGLPAVAAMFYPKSAILMAHEAALDPPPPSAIYLTIRQIQESLGDNPDDALAYLNLGSAYFKLLWKTKERDRSYYQGFVHPALIRHTQIVTALNQALKIDPDLEAAHALLADHYMNCRQFHVPNYYENNLAVNYVDAELEHRESQLRLSRTHGEPPKALEDEVKQLKAEVERQTILYDINAANKQVVQQAFEALKLGLGVKAQSILEKADAKDLTVGSSPNSLAPGYMLRIKLLLSLGRAEEVRREALTEENKKLKWGTMPDLGLPTYEWFELLAAAAVGDYDEADRVLGRLAEADNPEQLKAQAGLAGGAGLYVLLHAADKFGANPPLFDVIQILVASPDLVAGKPLGQSLNGWLFTRMVELARQQRARQASLKTLRGWLALESGNVDLARQQFRGALEMAQFRSDDTVAAFAVGTTLPGTTHLLNLYSTPLAVTGLRWMEIGAR
jgi:tetratricopeptide (TPR) repeat protein